jgi:signal peptidase II
MLAIAAVVLAADLVAKGLVTSSLQPGERHHLFLGFDLARVRNEGIAFGILDDGGGLVIAVTAVALVAVILWFASAPTRPGLWLGVGLLLGGALGNLVDRIAGGGVTDFIDPPLWPAFNLADIAITAGVVVLVTAALAPQPAGAATEP